MATNTNKEVTGWTGWVYFAGIIMVLMGTFQAIAGLAALLNDEYYLVTQQGLLAFDYTTWGWIHLLMGFVVVAAGTAVVNGRTWGRIVAVVLASLSALANFAFMPAYPIWSIIMITIDFLIIYALVVHGAEVQE